MTILTGLALITLGMVLAGSLLVWSLIAPKQRRPRVGRGGIDPQRSTPRMPGRDPFDRFH